MNRSSTFLVEQFFEGKYDFKFVGGHNLRTRDQLNNFAKALKAYSGTKPAPFKDWVDAFDALEDYLSTLPDDRRKVIFIDEMPWMDSRRSDFVSALEYFWNGWASSQYNIVLVATGSATSWMTDKLIKNRGGLHNRIRHRIYLKPFSLKETEEYLQSRSVHWDRYQILQGYMLTGGVPFYLKMLEPQQSFAQNVDRLCFSDTGAEDGVRRALQRHISRCGIVRGGRQGSGRQQIRSDKNRNQHENENIRGLSHTHPHES